MTRHQEYHDLVYGTTVVTEEHKASWTHEIIGGAAAFAAMKAFNDKQEKSGNPVDHALAKELLAAMSGAAIDNLIETKGLTYIDKVKSKKHAEEEAQKLYSEQTGYYE